MIIYDVSILAFIKVTYKSVSVCPYIHVRAVKNEAKVKQNDRNLQLTISSEKW